MADLRINGWSDESFKCQQDLDLKRELVALLSLSSWCLVMVVWLFLAVPWVCLRFVIVVFSDHTNLLFLTKNLQPDLDPNCSSMYPVSTYYIRKQATGVSLARDGMLARYSCNLVQYAEKRISMQNVKMYF